VQHNDRIVPAEQACATISSFEKADVAVVGSGPAGTVVAIALAERGLRVLLLEAGGRHVDADATPFFEFVSDQAAHRVDYGLSMQIGGSTNLWSGRSARFETGDISTDRGWPFEQAHLIDHYRRAEDIIGIRLPTEATVGQPQGWEGLSSGEMDLKRFVWSRPARNMATVLTERLADLPDLVVVQGARCTGLNTHEGQVTSLTVVAGGETQTVTAKRIVLAAGGLETARLLMTSDIARGLPAVGRYLGTHPKHGVGHILLNRMVRLSSPLFVDTNLDGQWQRYGLGLSESGRMDGLNHYVQLSPRFEKLGQAMLDLGKRRLASSTGNGSVAKALQTRAAQVGQVAFNVMGRIGVYQRFASKLSVRGFFDQYPDPANGLSLLPERDPFGVPRARVSWRLGERDFTSIRTFLEILSDHVARAGLGRFVSSLPDHHADWDLTGVHSHFMGTTRMGFSPATSVADRHGRVHGQERLFLSGPGLFTTYSYANPVLTITALALRVAEGVERSLAE
jgi:choline dehydrogenase-like flavoprotein